jgi:hypothetical protein
MNSEWKIWMMASLLHISSSSSIRWFLCYWCWFWIRSFTWFIFWTTTNLYIDLFDKNRLDYLTPDSPNEITHFDHDAVYILGGTDDDENKELLTYRKSRSTIHSSWKITIRKISHVNLNFDGKKMIWFGYLDFIHHQVVHFMEFIIL